MELWSDFLTNQGRMIHKWAHYFPIYQRHFERFKGRPFVMWEIGCGDGGSLAMWQRFFGPFVQVIGIDIRPECRQFESHNIHVRIGDQSDERFLSEILNEFDAPSIVIDDGSHVMDHVNATFSFLYEKVQQDGVYAVEDLHTAYWPEYGGGLRAEGSFIERCKSLIDEINGQWTPDKVALTNFTRTTISMSFYDSIVVFEKGRVLPSISLASEEGIVREGFKPG